MPDQIAKLISQIPNYRYFGRVSSINGLMVEADGLKGYVAVGTKCSIISTTGERTLAEVVSINDEKSILMPFEEFYDVTIGCRVDIESSLTSIFPSEAWRGRVIDALGRPIDDKGPLSMGEVPYKIKSSPISAHKRRMVEGKIDLGVKAINTFATCCNGQRMGIFAGSGIGKSMLISMLTKYSTSDIKVIGLVGERGRELQEFLQNYLGEEGLKNAVVIAATSDQSSLMRRQAAYLTMAVSEYFRDQGNNVLCFLDSVTRFAMAQREIGLSAGEPPATRGYTPSVFYELPRLLERAGPGGLDQGNITALFTVLVEGDDHNEPISDTVRGILDGHIVLDRKIAERGRYPAIDILKSVSRTMPDCNNEEQNEIVNKAISIMSTYEDMAEMIRLGAYKKGSDPEVDNAIKFFPKIEDFLRQKPNESSTLDQGYQTLKQILSEQ
jgi:flagellum-specific ATP synthase